MFHTTREINEEEEDDEVEPERKKKHIHKYIYRER